MGLLKAINHVRRMFGVRRARPVDARWDTSPHPSDTPVPAGGPNSAGIFTQLYELALGIETAEVPTESEHAALAARLRASFDNAVSDPAYTPRRPLLLPQLLRAMNDNDVSRRELTGIIVRDPALAGALLKLANSSYYRIHTQPVESIDRAIALIGTDGMRSLAAAAVMQPIFSVASVEFARFPEIIWAHTLHTTTAAEALASSAADVDPFSAQLLSLLMGLGTIIVFRVALDQADVRQSVHERPAMLVQLLDAHAADMARRIAVSWNLSKPFVSALETRDSDKAERGRTPLQRTLYVGRVMGALAVLEAHERIDAATARAVMLTNGCPVAQFEAIWAHLMARTDAS